MKGLLIKNIFYKLIIAAGMAFTLLLWVGGIGLMLTMHRFDWMALLMVSPWVLAYALIILRATILKKLNAFFGALWSLICMALVTGPIVMAGFRPFMYAVSGQLFQGKWHRDHAGGALDQPTIGKWLFWTTVFIGLNLPVAAGVRWVANRTRRLEYWAYALPTLAMCIFIMGVLTVPFYWLIQYIEAMGSTPRRTYGILYSLACYAILIGFLIWSLRPPKKSEKSISTVLPENEISTQ